MDMVHKKPRSNKGEIAEGEVDVRESLRRLTASWSNPLDTLAQEFLTWMTGKPHLEQKPLVKPTRLSHLGTALASLLGGAAVSATIWNHLPQLWFLLPISWSFTVGGARKIQTMLLHRCVHRDFFGDKRDRWLAEILSTILLIQDYSSYFRDHCKLHHHVKKFSTFEHDPDAQFLWKLGFRPTLTDGPNSSLNQVQRT
jgi:hypothetical protein